MPKGYVGDQWIRDQAYYEFKDVPVKGRVYRYWYFRIFADGRLRSIYCGKQRPELSPLDAAAALRAGEDLAAQFREQRSGTGAKPASGRFLPKPPAVTRRSIAVARRALAVRLDLGRERALAPRGPRLPKPRRRRRNPG